MINAYICMYLCKFINYLIKIQLANIHKNKII